MKIYKVKNIRHFYLKVDDIHTIYVEESGNPDGIPLLLLHGGPGIPLRKGYQKMYNGNKFRIITFHQRGCGMSIPKNCLIKNKTKYILNDIEMIRNVLGIKKWLVEGISWGATLAVIYGINYPKNLIGLIVGGLSLMTKRTEKSTQACAPDIYSKWMYKRTDEITMDEYFKKLQSKDSKVRNLATKMWNVESELFDKMDFKSVKMGKRLPELDKTDANTLALMECYYYKNRGFIPHNYILNNAYKLNDVPGYIIHGRYDLICSAENAYKLSSKWTNAKLIITEMSGHSFKNVNNLIALQNALNSFIK